MHQPTVIVKDTVGPHEDVIGDCGSEDLHAEGVLDDLFGLFVQVGVDQGHVVIAGDAVAQSGQFLLNATDFYALGEAVPDVAQLVVLGGVGHEQTFFVP